MKCPLIIAGDEIRRNKVKLGSPFYEGYEYQVAQAKSLEVAAAIGAVRKAVVPNLEERSAALRRASQIFKYEDHDVEHAVRLTGMPITQIAAMFDEIPRWLTYVPDLFESRFRRFGASGQYDKEWINPILAKLLTPREGFCYALSPGNDPRTTALVAANLGYLGIPFILRASNKDAAAPLIIQAMINGGFDPSFCNLVYFDLTVATESHFHLLDCSSITWTFGSAERVDSRFRYKNLTKQVVIDLPEGEPEVSQSWLAGQVKRHSYRVETIRRDLFEGRLVLRHDSGNCAAVTNGPFSEELRANLQQSIAYPLGCTATKSIMAIEGADFEATAVDWLSSLVVGDPMDPNTQVGYIDPTSLDGLESLVKKNQISIKVYGGERLSACQARPMLVSSQEDVPDFFGQEIPAYVVGLRACNSLEEAVEQLNHYSLDGPRLAVSFNHMPVESLEGAIVAIRAHTVMIDQPTTRVIPIFHEGNDYAHQLGQNKLVVYGNLYDTLSQAL